MKFYRPIAFLVVFLMAFQVQAADIFVDRVSCRLADAIRSANQDAAVGGCSAGNGADIITVVNDSGNSITFSSPIFTTVNTRTALPIVTSSITIQPSVGRLSLLRSFFSAQFFRIFEVDENGSLTLNQVYIENGDLSDITDVSSSGSGGAIRSAGRLNFNDVIIRNNRAAQGGGVYLERDSVTTIVNSDIQSNVANGFGGGFFIASSLNRGDTTLEISDSSIRFNRSGRTLGDGAGQGGGLFISRLSSAKLTRTSVTRNSVIRGEDETLLIDSGGAINVQPSSILQAFDSTLSHNSGRIGSSISAFSDVSVSLINTTISQNAGSNSAAVSVDGNSSVITIRNSILSGNGTDQMGAELSFTNVDMADSIDLRNNIIGHSGISTSSALSFSGTSQTPQQLFVDTLLATSDSGTATALGEILNPLPLQSVLLESHSLPDRSPAIDAAMESLLSGFPLLIFSPGCRGDRFGVFGTVNGDYRTDQLGNTRPKGSGCDIGAIEADDSSFFVIPLPSGDAVIFSM